MKGFVLGVGWYEHNEVCLDWRGRHPIKGRRFPLRQQLVYVDRHTYYVGAQCERNRERRDAPA